MMLKVWAAGVAVAAAGCGYSLGGLPSQESVWLPIFDTLSERRTHEFDLHEAVSRELKRQGVRVNDPSATVEMRGKILDITEPSVVEGTGDVVVVGAVSFRVEITLVSRSTGKEIKHRVFEESANFSTARSESRDTARQEVIDRLARRVVTLLWKDW